MTGGIERVGRLLSIAEALILLVACANVASFQLSTAASGSHDRFLRAALGGSRRRLAQAALADALAIVLAGGALGIVVAVWTSRIVPALLFQEDAATLVQVPDVPSILFWSSACLGIFLICGLAPLFESSQAHPANVLRRGSSSESKKARAVRAILIVGQMAVCCLLVISTGYLHQGFRAALQTSISVKLGEPILATVQADPLVGLRYFQEIERAVRNVPGLSAMGWTTRLPGNQPVMQSFRIDFENAPMREVEMDIAAFTAASVKQFRMPLIAGRTFGFVDKGCRSAIVNETAGKLLGDATVGRVVYDFARMPAIVIGIGALKNASTAARPMIYYDATDPASPTLIPMSGARFRTSAISELPKAEMSTVIVSPEFLATTGFSLVAGRMFVDDQSANRCRVAVMNREAAETYFGGSIGGAVIDEAGHRTDIIGVVQSAPLVTMDSHAKPEIDFPMEQDYPLRMTALLKAPNASETMLSDVRRVLQAAPGRGPSPMIVRSLETHLRQTGLAPLRVATAILDASAVTALLLSILGLYGTLSDTAKRQRRQIAIRIALGARPYDIVRRVFGQGARLSLAGAVAGMAASLLISSLLSRVAVLGKAPPAWVWMAGPIVLACAVAVASAIPARRSLMVDPLRALRED